MHAMGIEGFFGVILYIYIFFGIWFSNVDDKRSVAFWKADSFVVFFFVFQFLHHCKSTTFLLQVAIENYMET